MFYELLYIIPNKYSETECKEINAKIKSLAEQEKLEFVKEEDLGKKKLAYPIKQVYYGYYLLDYFKTEENKSNLANFNQKLKLMPEVLRYQIIKYKNLPEKTEIFDQKEEKPVAEAPARPEEPKEVKETKKNTKVDLNELDKKLDELLKNVDA